MKNIKVNFKDSNNKRTSTTINGNISWAYFQNTDEFNQWLDTGNPNEILHPYITKSLQRFIKNISIHEARLLNKDVIETKLIHAIVNCQNKNCELFFLP